MTARRPAKIAAKVSCPHPGGDRVVAAYLDLVNTLNRQEAELLALKSRLDALVTASQGAAL